jgi:hypothetical protein
MPVLGERHDLAHPVEGDEAWSESYYFNGYDPVTDTGLFTRMAVRPNEGTLDVGLTVWLPGEELAWVRGVREQREMVDTGLEVGGVSYERVQPMRSWRIRAEAEARVTDLRGTERRRTPLAVDLTFEALAPAIGTDGQEREAPAPDHRGREGPAPDRRRQEGRSPGPSAETRKSVGKGHLEQPGRWSGTIEADGMRHELADARGNRDKSWGPRRWGGPRMWRWFSINLGDDVHFGGIRIGTDAGDLHRGWVWMDGEATSIDRWDVRTELEDDGLTHRVSHVTATDKAGRVHELRGDLLRVAAAPARRGTVVNEGLARWSLGDRVGYGISEYLHQLDGSGRPLVPIE